MPTFTGSCLRHPREESCIFRDWYLSASMRRRALAREMAADTDSPQPDLTGRYPSSPVPAGMTARAPSAGRSSAPANRWASRSVYVRSRPGFGYGKGRTPIRGGWMSGLARSCVGCRDVSGRWMPSGGRPHGWRRGPRSGCPCGRPPPSSRVRPLPAFSCCPVQVWPALPSDP